MRVGDPTLAFEQHAARADALAESTGCDTEPLRFAAGMLRAQARAVRALAMRHAVRPLSGRLELDHERILEALLEVPRFAAWHGPEPLALEACSRAVEDGTTASNRLLVFWNGGRSSTEDYLSRAMLRPYLETLRAEQCAPDRPHVERRCPFCGGAPAVGCLRGGAQGQDAGRFLVCAQCGLEWAIDRVLCVACGERDPAKLPCFSSESRPAVRADACETCRRYVKTLDLSQDARPIPEVDDLTSLALDLWAGEQGFVRIEPGLAGI